MKKRQLIIIGSALLIIAIGAAGFKLLASLKEAPLRKGPEKIYRLVKVREVVNDTLTQRIPVQGKLVASEKVELFSEVTGKLLRQAKSFKVGQHFDQGETLLSIDGNESLLNLRSQRSGFISSLSQTMPDIKIDYAEYYSAWKAFHAALEPEKPLPDLPDLSDPKLKSFLSGRSILQQFYAIRSLEERQSKFTLFAPFSGTVSMGSVNAGTVIRAGQKIGEMIKDGAFELEAALPLKDAGVVKIGDRVSLQSGENSKGFEGKVIRMASHVSPSDQRQSIYVGLDDGRLKEGMYLEGIIEVASIHNALAIDRNLVSPDGYVYLVADSVLVRKQVEIQDLFDESALIQGLHDGDLLLDQVVEGAFEGMLVKTESTSK
ncbi:MAG: HlyD family efflux transporter periplasmic adaptor subunit [Cryomorphaceae bacterium]